MKKFVFVVVLLGGFSVFGITSSVFAQEKKASPVAKANELIRVEFKITGTDCPMCLNRIKEKIDSVKGVKKTSIWLWRPYYGVVVYDPKLTNWKVVEKVVEEEHVVFSELVEQAVRAEPERQVEENKKAISID